ncbi:MAG: imidazoleglycerol-phosphate dehydratase HisB [Coriobacteriales bacterium]|jgi:imidazoleglycerol-phosphate dehydratase|nr:imidazoleglycerol-phosphate dehydratase HisB [Coriobacteriales bacterium]
MGRTSHIARQTKETDVDLTLGLDGQGHYQIESGIPFFDHMLTAFARHGLFDLKLRCVGDLEVDAHHSVEDVGIVLGSAIAQGLGDKAGISRFGSAIVPMDEALVLCAIDISGRGGLYYQVNLPIEFIGSFDTTLFKEFMVAVAREAKITVHLRSLAGENSHHLIEAAAKAFGLALRQAVTVDPRRGGELPTTKGSI